MAWWAAIVKAAVAAWEVIPVKEIVQAIPVALSLKEKFFPSPPPAPPAGGREDPNAQIKADIAQLQAALNEIERKSDHPTQGAKDIASSLATLIERIERLRTRITACLWASGTCALVTLLIVFLRSIRA